MNRQLAQLLAMLSSYNVDLKRMKVATEYVNLSSSKDAALLIQALAEHKRQIVGGVRHNINELGGEIKIVSIKGRIISTERVSLPRVIVYKCAFCGTKFRKTYSVLHAINEYLRKHNWTVAVCPACRYEAKMTAEDRHEVYSMVKAVVSDGTGTITVFAPTDLFPENVAEVGITGVYMPHPLGHFIYVTGIDTEVVEEVAKEQVLDALYRFITADTLTVGAILASVIRPSKTEVLRTLIYITRYGYSTWQHIYRVMTSVAVKTRVINIPKLKLHPSTPVLAFAKGTDYELDLLNDVFNGTLYYGGGYVHLNNNLVVYTTNVNAFKTLRKLSWDLIAVVSKPYVVNTSAINLIIAGVRTAVLKYWHVDVEGCEHKICKSVYKLIGKKVMASVVRI